MVRVAPALFLITAVPIASILLYFDHVLFAVSFLISDLAVFISVKNHLREDRVERVYWTSFLLVFGIILTAAHFVFRGTLDWSNFQSWEAVQNVQLSGGGEVLLGFSVCVMFVGVVFRELKKIE